MDFRLGGQFHRDVIKRRLMARDLNAEIDAEISKVAHFPDPFTPNPFEFAREYLNTYPGQVVQCMKELRDAYPQMGLAEAKCVTDFVRSRL